MDKITFRTTHFSFRSTSCKTIYTPGQWLTEILYLLYNFPLYRVARKRQFCQMCVPFLCQNSTLIVNLTFDNIRLLIEERTTMLSKMFCCLDQVSYHGFHKKSRGTDIFGLCFVNMTQRVLCCWKNYIQMLISACLHCLLQKNMLTLGST